MSAESLRDLAAGTGAADVSSLIALRALVSRAGDDGTASKAGWLTALREEYRRWYADPAAAPGASGQPTNFPEPETLAYLDEHILPHLVGDGVIAPSDEAAADGDGGGADGAEDGDGWSSVRLSPWAAEEVRTDRSAALAVLDERIRAVLAAQSVGADRGPPPGPTPGGDTLEAQGLVKTYRKRRVVNDVALDVSQGEIVGLLGPNGAGKTTTFYMMVGLIAPDRGTVRLGRKDLTGVPMYRRARAGIGYLAQEPSIFRRLTVEENVLAILQMMKLSKAEQHRRLEELLDELSIKHLRKTYAYALSGGERRRLEITRALVARPKFMLLDEPFAGVDPIAVHDIQQIVSDLRRRGIGVLISDHNVEQTLDIVDRAYIMYDGRVRVSGTVSELVWNEEVAEIYLGPTLTARMRERYSNPEKDRAV